MSKVWYCPNCGYEVTGRGRCHSCRERLVASALPELPAGEDTDEVGYRLDGWVDRERGRLIERLNFFEILHRFEEDELVVAAEDEARVDDLVAELAANPEEDWSAHREVEDNGEGLGPEGANFEDEQDDEAVVEAVRMLADAAGRLRRDPTDMHADADVAEASAGVFMADEFYGTDAETWAAVGRVTRRLLSALGADEALEEEIRSQAAVLDKLLAPLVAPAAPPVPEPAAEPVPEPAAEPVPEPEQAGESEEAPADEQAAAPAGKEAAAPAVEPAVSHDEAESGRGETVYELPEWLPEQRAQFGVFLDDAGISYEWEGDDLVVPVAREAEVEALFERVGGPAADDDDDGGESRYRAIEELFAAADRLAGDPSDEERGADVVAWIGEAAGSPPIGMDEVYWFRIMTQARNLSESIASSADDRVIADEAAALRELLRAVV